MIVNADSLCALPLADASVQMCVTSPPYYQLRDYDIAGQLGLETTPEEYICNMVKVFQDVRRVLADSGTLWVNIGDSYSNQDKTGGSGGGKNYTSKAGGYWRGKRETGVKQKDLLGIPWMLAFALRADGWYLRSDVIWSKPNVLPESVTDRFTKSHEYLFLLAKRSRYYFDADAIREPLAKSTVPRAQYPRTKNSKHFGREDLSSTDLRSTDGARYNPAGRNKRTVWEIPTDPFAGAHFATFPPALVEPCILAGSRVGDIVLDPFCGSGTTGAVARLHGRRFVGIDLNMKYLSELALPRAENRQTAQSMATLPLFAAQEPAA